MSHTETINNTTELHSRLIIRILIWPFLFLTKALPLSILRMLSVPVMAFFYVIYPTWRRTTNSNLRHVLGKKTPIWKIHKASFKIYKSYGRYIVDLSNLTHAEPEKALSLISKTSGYEHLNEALGYGKGAILLTCHIGNWELGGIVLSKLGHPVNVVYFPDASAHLEEERKTFRRTKGVNQIVLENSNFSPIKMLKALQRNELVALQGDKLFYDKGIEVPFFGAPAKFPRGPVLLAMTADAPILPSFIVFNKDHTYHTIIDKPIYMKKTKDREKDLLSNLNNVAAVLEKYIKKYHTQWYCFSPFWREDAHKTHIS